MLFIDKNGMVDAERIIIKRFSTIERRNLDKVNGIVVHQTNSLTAQSTFNSYSNDGANGAHFLIDKDGTIYQTASLYRVTNHVGYLQSRCVLTKKCTEMELKHSLSLERIKGIRQRSDAIHANEKAKAWPDRYPSNADSIGIEIVGKATGEKGKEIFETVTDAQNASLKWLIQELSETLGVSMQEIYKHPQVGRKNLTEASTAKW